ncbi:MAG TPA: RNA 2',3'-cyclic phosphodiesterase [Thermoanaerobaculia bacterium]
MRLFIATTFPDAVTTELNRRVEPLKPKLPPASWVRPETQHLTLAFLGDHDPSIVDRLAAIVDERLRAIKQFEAKLRGCGFFPNRRHARVGWVGLEPETPFINVAAAVRDAVKSSGIELDRADFKPHLTIMRIRDPWPPASADTFQKGLAGYESTPFTVDRVTLFSSQLNPKGAIHTALREFALA